MKSQNSIRCTTGLFFGVLLMQACSNYEPVSVSECNKVVAHATKVLGSFAPSQSEMMVDCKKATDNERGCIMASTKKGQIAQCM
jgi:hypothetical protein